MVKKSESWGKSNSPGHVAQSMAASPVTLGGLLPYSQ
jgi:hypothetical protein